VSDGAGLSGDGSDFLGLGGSYKLTGEVMYRTLESNGKYYLTSKSTKTIFIHLSYVTNPGVGRVEHRESSHAQVHVSSGPYGSNNLWQYTYDIVLPGRTESDVSNRLYYTFRLVPTFATGLTSARISWSLNSATEDSLLAAYPTPKLYDEEALRQPYLGPYVAERDEDSTVVSTEVAPAGPPALPAGSYRLECDVSDGFVYTMYHELLAQYKTTAPMVLWNLSYYPDGTTVMLQQDTVNGSGWLGFIGGPVWSDQPRYVKLVWKGSGWAIGDGDRFIGGYTSAGGPGYAESLATYTPSYPTLDNALSFKFVRSLQDVK